ncbi:MAG: siderophore ABC transporter substrate-binding protein [Thiopseudomonas sp.]
MQIKSSLFKLLSVPVLLLVFSHAAAAATLTIKHSQGETQVEQNPKTVAVLDWSTLDTMAALGVEAQGIPGGNILPAVLPQYADAKFVRIGTLFEPDFEALKNLKPDLIILGRRAAGHFEEASKYGPTLDLTPDPKDLLGSVVRHTELLGEIFERQDEAAKVTAELKDSVARLQQLTAKQGSGLTLLTTGGKMAAFGIGTRFGLIHDVFGMDMAAKDLAVGRHGQSVSYEFILETNPDWLFVMDRDAAIGREGVAAKQMMDNELVAVTTAGSKQQIVYLDPEAWYLLDSSGARVLQSNINQLLDVFGDK